LAQFLIIRASKPVGAIQTKEKKNGIEESDEEAEEAQSFAAHQASYERKQVNVVAVEFGVADR
jgi:hypothetical protein